MKKTLSLTLMTLLLCVCMVFGFTGCANQEDINTAIAPISEQITAINTSIDDLKAVDTALDGYIDALETKVTELEASDTATADEITAVKSAIEALKTKDTELEGKITTLENYVKTELSETEDWAEATFATLAQYAEIQTEISNIKKTLTTLVDTTALSTAISTSEDGMKEWVNKTLADGYYTIAEIDTKLSDLETKLNGADDTLEAAIEEQKTALANAKTELTTAYTAAINEAIEKHDGEITKKIEDDIKTAKAELQTQIDGINNDIDEIRADIAKLNNTVSDLQDKIAELEEQINVLNCLNDIHVWNAGVCNHCETVCEHIDTVVTDNVCECGITVATYTVQGATALLTIPSNVSTPTITSSMNAINSLETTTLIVNGEVNDEQYQLVKNDLKSGTALFFADITTNNYVAANGAVYSCEIGSVSNEKYVLIADVLRSWTPQQYQGTYSNCIGQLQAKDSGARAISTSEDAWEQYLIKIKSDIPSDLSYWVLANTSWGFWKESETRWYSSGWNGYQTDTFYWYPVFDVPLS